VSGLVGSKLSLSEDIPADLLELVESTGMKHQGIE
jgi:hypothetical protein